MLTESNLDELEKLANLAKPLPWYVNRNPQDFDITLVEMVTLNGQYIGMMRPHDAKYVITACNAVPELIAKVRKLEQQRDWLAKKCEDLSDDVEDSFMPYHISVETWIERAEEAIKE
jgi:hypothetical protein